MATLRGKGGLLRGLLSKHGEAYHGPFFVCVWTTYRCNLRCPWCRFHSATPDVKYTRQRPDVVDFPLPMFERLCQQLRPMGTHTLVLTGEGEPLMHPRLLEMVAVAKQAGLQVILLTNGTRLDVETIHALVNLKLDVLQVSLWCSSKEAYAETYPGADPANFDKILAALDGVASVKKARASELPHVRVNHPLTRRNHRSLDVVVELVRRTGCNGVKFSPLRTHKGKLDDQSLRPAEEQHLRRELTANAKRLRTLGIDHNIDDTLLRYQLGEDVWKTLPCYMGWIQAHVKANGTVRACNVCELPIGDLNEATFEEIWSGPEALKVRRQMLTREGLAELGDRCDCGFCSMAPNNTRVHKLFRWLAPLRNLR